MPTFPDDEIKGAAIAAWSLSLALLLGLSERRVFSEDDHDQIVDLALEKVERLQAATDPAVRKARELLDGIPRISARGP